MVSMQKWLVDLVFMTKRKRRQFERNNPDEKILAADGSKGIITGKDKDIQHSIEWITSQRAVILLTDKRIVCGKWNIPLEAVSSSQLIAFNSIFGKGQVLKLQTEDGKNYQFGMQYNPEWANQQTLPLTYEQQKVTYSKFSVIIRIFALIYFIYWLYHRFFAS